jgi:uncharacterized membrane protein
MDKQAFLGQLERSLSFLSKEEREERLDFYEEMIDDRMEEGLSETETVASLGSMEEILGKLILERGDGEQPKVKRNRSALETVLLVLGAPVWLSLVIAAFAVVISLYAVLWSVVGSLWAVWVSLMACVLAGILAGVTVLVSGQAAAGLVWFGGALICAGLAVFLFFGCYAATKGSARVTNRLANCLMKLFRRKEAV